MIAANSFMLTLSLFAQKVKEAVVTDANMFSQFVQGQLAQTSQDSKSESYFTSGMRLLSSRVEPKYTGPLVFLAFLSIFVCCATSTHCVRTARDCKIALNAMNIRR
jgi:hypothetical protein